MRIYSLRHELHQECLKHIRRYEASLALDKKRRTFFTKRTTLKAARPALNAPPQWDVNPAFNPFYVRKRLETFAHAVSNAIDARAYRPHPALHVSIDKPGGGTRTIAISTIVDSAVSRWLYRRLLARNIHRLSSYAFAYRPDRKIVHAIEYLQAFVSQHSRLFVVEYDFASYFDTINHNYLIGLIKNRMSIGGREMAAAEAIIKGAFAASRDDYVVGNFKQRTCGIPQGSCLSLFLANLACIELDDQLEKTGVCYARYADDTVILCQDYLQATRCANIMHAHECRAGTKLNFEKSEGISLLTRELQPELRSKIAFNYLGHEIRDDGIGLAEKTEKRIKRKLAKIVYRHLLFYPSRADWFGLSRIDLPNRIDWDLVTCVNEVRKYIYGTLNEHDVAGQSELGDLHNKNLHGVVAFFSSITCGERFRSLDGWLASCVRRALSERRRRLWGRFGVQAPLYSQKEIVDGSWYAVAEVPNETRLPSFFRAWKTVRRLVFASGPSIVPERGYSY